jgi:CO dehydrogenase maturation factor
LKIAVSGKGGVGKTTISASIIRTIANKGYQVYAVDADPDVSLGTTLGFPEQLLEGLVPLVEMRDVIAEKSGGGGAYFSLNPGVDDVPDRFSIKSGNIKLLRMGGVKQGGTACYCRENSFLNAVVNALLLKEKEVVVLDMGAGIEHLTRGTAQGVDVMLIVTEPTKVSVQTANVIKKLAQDIGVPRLFVVGNKVRNGREKEFLETAFSPSELIGIIPFAETVLDQAMGDGATTGIDSPLLELEGILDQILREAGEQFN